MKTYVLILVWIILCWSPLNKLNELKDTEYLYIAVMVCLLGFIVILSCAYVAEDLKKYIDKIKGIEDVRF